jgi:hypothetical protein
VIQNNRQCSCKIMSVAACSVPITYGMLVTVNPQIFLSIGFCKIAAFSTLFIVGGAYITRQFGNGARVFPLLFLSILLLGSTNSIIATIVFVLLLAGAIIYHSKIRVSVRDERTAFSQPVWEILIPAVLLAFYNLSFVVSEIPEFFSDSAPIGGDPDWIFQLLLAKNVANLGVVTTGLDGTPLMQYHWLPYYLYNAIANITGASLKEVLVLIYATFINPLIVSAIVLSAIMITSDNRESVMPSYWLAAILLLGGVLSAGIVSGGFYIGPYASVGVLFVFLFSLAVIQDRSDYLSHGLLAMAITLSKVPFGVMTICFLLSLVAYDYLRSRRLNFPALSIAIFNGIFFAIFWFWITNPQGDSSPFYPGNMFELFHIRHVFEKSSEITNLFGALGLTEYRANSWLNIGIALVSIYWPLGVCLLWFGSRKASRRFLVASFMTGAIGSIALSFTFFNGHHIYLAGYGSILVLPLLVSGVSTLLSKEGIISWRRALGTLLVVAGAVGFSSQTNFALSSIKGVSKHIRTEGWVEDIEITALREIGEIEEKRDYLVYISPKNQFWKSCHPSKAFRIPLITNRAALRGLVYCKVNGNLWSAQNYYWWSYGYSAYSKLDFDRSQKSNPLQTVLCEEVLRKGFRGYFELTQENSIKSHSCS